MAALDFDEGEKKSRDILDLNHVRISSESELKKWLEKVPDYKIRPEKVRMEDVSIDDAILNAPEASASSGENLPGSAASSTTFPFLDPVPPSMREVNIRELGRVNINWRMLTLERPKTKLEEDIFSRLVQLEKLQYRTLQWEQDQEAMRSDSRGSLSRRVGGAAKVMPQRNRTSRGGSVTEVRLQTCKECGEEFCSGTCKKYLYDEHARTPNPLSDEMFTTRGPKGRRGNAMASSGQKLALKKQENSAKCDPNELDEDDEIDDDNQKLDKNAPSGLNAQKQEAPSTIHNSLQKNRATKTKVKARNKSKKR